MVNFSDLSKMAGKFDVSGLVKNVKTMVNPGHAADVAAAATPLSGDALSQKIAEITASVQALTAAHTKQAEQITELNKALEQLRVQAASAAIPTPAQPSTAEAATLAASAETDKPDASQNPTEEGK